VKLAMNTKCAFWLTNPSAYQSSNARSTEKRMIHFNRSTEWALPPPIRIEGRLHWPVEKLRALLGLSRAAK
jgi:hypothetical protein